MFTLCTRTVYLGADFYSTNARSFIFSDANINCLNVDISMDLEQILGRQRLDENPWKNRANLYVKTNFQNITEEQFRQRIVEKFERTKLLLSVFEKAEEKEKGVLLTNYEKVAKAFNYLDDYLGINCHAGKNKMPAINHLVLISEMRAFELQSQDYKDRFSVFSTIQQIGLIVSGDDATINSDLLTFNSKTTYIDKLRYLCESVKLSGKELDRFLDSIPLTYKNAYLILGPTKLKSLSYQKSKIEEEYKIIMNNQSTDDLLTKKIYHAFTVGGRYSKEYIKTKLREIYVEVGYKKTPKATDLKKWFDIRKTQVTNKVTGKRDNGFVLTRIK